MLEKINTPETYALKDTRKYELKWQKAKTKSKKCLFYANKECKVPEITYEKCISCPHGYSYFVKAVVGNIYKKIVGAAINILNAQIDLSTFFGQRK